MKNINVDKFLALLKDQFTYGGKKYAKNSKKEATDILFERHTHRWLVGTIDKYTFRYANLARERDLLKIATYMYILWLKRGFHIHTHGLGKVINTTVKIKSNNFEKFSSSVFAYTKSSKYITSLEKKHYGSISKVTIEKSNINFISNMMRSWSRKSFIRITQQEVIDVFNACFFEWIRNYVDVDDKNRDKDTWNSITKQLA